MDHSLVVLAQLDIPTSEQVLAFGAKAHLVERPPLFERIAGLEQFQPATICLGESGHASPAARITPA
ncbi:hypothetical protein ACXR0O_19395 [Verrucomicrobiota bacterium sgz303538]